MPDVCKLNLIVSNGVSVESNVLMIPDTEEALLLIGEFVEKMKGLNHANY